MLSRKKFSREFKEAFEESSGMEISYLLEFFKGLIRPFLFGAIVATLSVYAYQNVLKGVEDLAAWVQAIGSISAIFFAIYIGKNQNKNNLKILYEGKRIDQELENENTLMEIYSIALLVERMGKTTSSFIRNMENKVDFIFLEEQDKKYKYDHNKITCFSVSFKLNTKKSINIGHFFSDLIDTHSHHKKRIQSFINSASIIDVTKYPKLWISHDLTSSYLECQDFIDLVDDFINYSDSIKEETDASKVMPNVFNFLNDLVRMHNNISDYQQSIFTFHDELSARLEKSINGPYWNRHN